MKKKKLLLLLLLSVFLLLPVRAGNYALVMNSPVTAVGNEFFVRVNLKNSAWVEDTAGSAALRIHYDSEALEYIGAYGGLGAPESQPCKNEVIIRDAGKAEEFSLRLHFKALQIGTTTVELTEAVLKDPNGAAMDCELGSSTISVLESIDEAGLYSLSVAQGKLEPAFSPEITRYELHVPADVTALQVSAIPVGYYATAYVEGHGALKNGHNLVTVDMTSGGGCSALYTIDVTRGDEPEPTPERESATVPELELTLEPEPVAEAEPEAAVTPEPVAEAEPEAVAEPEPAAEPVSEPTPTPAPEAPEEPAEETMIEDSPVSLKMLEKARDDMETAQRDAAAAIKSAKIAIVVSLFEFMIIVLLVIYIWKKNMRSWFFGGDEDEDEDEEYEEDESE